MFGAEDKDFDADGATIEASAAASISAKDASAADEKGSAGDNDAATFRDELVEGTDALFGIEIENP